jgi:hypothetical protein
VLEKAFEDSFRAFEPAPSKVLAQAEAVAASMGSEPLDGKPLELLP